MRRITGSLLPISAALFAIVFAITVIVNRWALGLDLIGAVNVALSAALGGSTPPGAPQWVIVFNMASTVAGTVLLWILLSHITALVLAERFEATMSKRARRMQNHVVVVGLGKVGYRVVQLLDELGVPTVAIENEPDSRFVDAVAARTPVLTGDGQLPENLERCNIAAARCIIACTNNDLSNLAACLAARELQPGIRTVSRVFEDRLATRLGKAFQVDAALSSTTIAASAFVGAAADAMAMRRIRLDGLELLAFRFIAAARVEPDTVHRWRTEGLRMLAIQRVDGDVEPTPDAANLMFRPGDSAIVVGPADAVRRVAEGYALAPG